ncbi:MAG: hypothetical protein HGA22_07660 [Clostridiales bacterium]|nr:hypothetical protein [Clostridiales bacterium]
MLPRKIRLIKIPEKRISGILKNRHAVQLQKLTHIPSIVWGVIWLAISLVAVNAVIIKGGSAPAGGFGGGSGSGGRKPGKARK